MENIKQHENDIRRFRRENAEKYKPNAGAILHTDVKSPDVIARITTVTEIKSTGFLTEAMIIRYGITKKGDVVDVLLHTYPGNNIQIGTG